MICNFCKREMEIDNGRDDNPYVSDETYVCECGASCELLYFGMSDEPSEVRWYDEDSEEVEIEEE